MGIWNSLAGSVQVEITGAVPVEILTHINNNNIQIHHITYVSDLTVSCVVARADMKHLSAIVHRRGGDIKIKDTQGVFWTLAQLRKRPVLVICCLIILLLALYLPTRIFFVRVEGNQAVSAFRIAEEAEHCGIRFGASRRSVRSEKVKNSLLGAIPQLQWAGVNTYGCVAVISVKERTQAQVIPEKTGISSVVADRDGVVKECTVVAGNPLCKVGQAVRKGQVLISGYTDCGLHIRAQRARGEVYADTIRHLDMVLPEKTMEKGSVSWQKTQYSFLVGKKLINLSKDSGISGAGCDKITKIHFLTLPGGFQLPCAIVVTTVSEYKTVPFSEEADREYEWMHSYARNYLQGQMIAGKINRADGIASVSDSAVYFTGTYDCTEMIGRTQEEELLKDYGEAG